MGQKFCTACGAALSDGIKFCETCGAPVDLVPLIPASPPPAFTGQIPVRHPAVTPPLGKPKKIPVTIVAGIIVVLIIAAAVVFAVLPKLSAGGSSAVTLPAGSGTSTSSPMTATLLATTSPTPAITAAPTPTPDPFPNALHLRDGFPFGTGKVLSEGTVYRFWMNDTYQWHNDDDNLYYVQHPKAGTKYLFVFINVFNKGDTRVWPPTSGNVKIYSDGQTFTPDPVHKLPDKASDRKDTPVEIKEIQYFSKFFGSEYAEDYGYSHGTQLAYLYPGKSNAIDGYLIFEVPNSLAPEKTYVEIQFNGNEIGVWKLV